MTAPVFLGSHIISVDKKIGDRHGADRMVREFQEGYQVAVDRLTTDLAAETGGHVTIGVLFYAVPRDDREREIVEAAHRRLCERK